MPDITMCKGITSDNIECVKRSTCYRSTAAPSEYRQTYFMFAPLVLVGEKQEQQDCEYFWKTEDTK